MSKKISIINKSQYISLTDFVYILLITILIIVLHGYAYGIGDQMLYIPLLQKILNPNLYFQDNIFPLINSHITLTYLLITSLAKMFNHNLFLAYAILYFVNYFFFYLGLFLLNWELFHNKLASLLSALFFILPIPVAGSAINTLEIYFTHRLTAITLLVYCLICLLRGRYLLIFIISGLMFLTHPLSAEIYIPLILLTILLISPKKFIAIFFKGLLIFGLIIIWIIPSLLNRIALVQIPFFVHKEWLEVLKLRNVYAFPLLWSSRSYIYLLITLFPLVLWFLYTRRKKKSYTDKIIFWILFISLVTFFFQIIFTSVFPISYVIVAQLGRIWIVSIIFSLSFGALVLSKLLSRLRLSICYWRLLIILFLLIITFFKRNYWLKLQQPDWIDVQLWVKQHTTPKCKLLVDFYSQGFRVYSQRPIVGEYKDGTLSFYSTDFAKIWNKKRHIFNQAEKNGLNQYLDQIYHQYPFSLIVVNKNENISLNQIYINDSYSIYVWPKLEKYCQINI